MVIAYSHVPTINPVPPISSSSYSDLVSGCVLWTPTALSRQRNPRTGRPDIDEVLEREILVTGCEVVVKTAESVGRTADDRKLAIRGFMNSS